MATSTFTRTADTPTGPARLHGVLPAGPATGVLVLGHGAGGGVGAPDLVAVAGAAVAAGWIAVLVEQPWRVAGKQVAPAPPRLDAAWVPTLAALREALREHPGADGALPLVVGGRSAGARVACRTAVEVGAAGVVTLAFPLHPPGRPERSRAAELALPVAAGLPLLAVQGRRDAFGTDAEVRAAARPGVQVTAVDGDHSLSAGAAQAADAVVRWLADRPECAPGT